MVDAHEAAERSRQTMVLGVTAVLFFLSLLPFELIPEVPVDIDAKPFFVPLALCVLLPSGRVGLSIGLGVALGEGLRDLMEGYELDDPLGFVGYVLSFWLASAIFALGPTNRLVLFFGSVLCAAIQAAFEASSFLIFGAEGLPVALQSFLGNTVSHGVVWGAIPLFFLLPRLKGKVAARLGFEPKGRIAQPLSASGSEKAETGPNIVAAAAGVSFAWPGEEPTIEGAALALRRGEIAELAGDGARTLAFVLAGLAPAATGGRLCGDVRPARRPALVSARPGDQVAQVRPLQQVASVLLSEGGDPGAALKRAERLLSWAGLPESRHDAYVWNLSRAELWLLALAGAAARRPDLLLVEYPSEGILPEGQHVLGELVEAQRQRGAAVLLGGDTATADRTVEIPGMVVRSDVPNRDPLRQSDPVRVPTLHSGRDSWWRRRDPRVKWVLLFALIALIYLAPDWRWMAGAALLGGIVAATARPSWGWLALALAIQVPNVIGLVLLPLLSGGEASEELTFGLRLVLGWIAAILFGIGLLSTMDMSEMVAGLRGLFLPRGFSFAVGYAFVLTYLTVADLGRRPPDLALRFSPRRPLAAIRSAAALLLPLFETVARRGGAMAVALAASGGGKGPAPFVLRRLDVQDLALLLGTAGLLIAATVKRTGSF